MTFKIRNCNLRKTFKNSKYFVHKIKTKETYNRMT